MSVLDQLIKKQEIETLVKEDLLALIKEAKSAKDITVKDTGDKIEEWLALRLNGEIDADELKALLQAQLRLVEQYLNSKEITSRVGLEKLTVGLIHLVLHSIK